MFTKTRKRQRRLAAVSAFLAAPIALSGCSPDQVPAAPNPSERTTGTISSELSRDGFAFWPASTGQRIEYTVVPGGLCRWVLKTDSPNIVFQDGVIGEGSWAAGTSIPVGFPKANIYYGLDLSSGSQAGFDVGCPE